MVRQRAHWIDHKTEVTKLHGQLDVRLRALTKELGAQQAAAVSGEPVRRRRRSNALSILTCSGPVGHVSAANRQPCWEGGGVGRVRPSRT
jgi:hypothetical protein